MILKKIKLKNFRQYYGEQELEFATDPNKNITLIYGKNGAGKTSFFTALNWVLYGSPEVKIDGKLVSKKAIEEAKKKNKEFVKGEVSLNFSHLGVDYQIKRTKIFDIKSNFEIDEIVEMYKLPYKIIHNPLIKLNPILPPNVRTYFFFDGEKIDEFSKPEHDKEVKEAVYKVLGVTVIERAISHTRDIVKEFNKELSKKSTGKLKELREKYEKLLEEEEILKEEINKLTEERKNLNILLEETKGRLKEIKEIEDYIKEKDRLEDKLKRLEERLNSIYFELSDIANKSFLIIGYEAFDDSEDIIKEINRDPDDIPSKYLIKLIEKIIKEKKCICGTEVNENIKENLIAKKIELKKDKKSELENILFELFESIQSIRIERNDLLKKLEENFYEKGEIKKEIKELRHRIDEIDQKLENHDIEDVKKLQKKQLELVKELGAIEERIERKKEELKNLKGEIETLQKEIQHEEKKQKEISILIKRKNLAEEILRQLELVYEKLSKGLKKEIEEEATKIFKKLIRKKEYFKRIELSDDYILRLVDIYEDKEAKTEISAGERQVLSLAFILALAKVSKKEAPIVMDTPFGRLDPDHRKNIIQEIPSIARQIVLFVTPSEMTDDLKELIADRIGKKYILEFDEDKKYTKIIPLGD